MKKSNVIVFAIAAVLSVFLLWLWYFLGFNQIDSPLDLIISIIWWVVIVALIAGVVKVEQMRREKIRTTYVGTGFLFNSEAGTVGLSGQGAVDAIERTIANLKYDFTAASLEDETKAAIKTVVRTKTYKPAESEDAQPTWDGEVCLAVPGAEAKPFASKEELVALLA